MTDSSVQRHHAPVDRLYRAGFCTRMRARGAHIAAPAPFRPRGRVRGLQNRVYKTITEDLPWELKSQNRR